MNIIKTSCVLLLVFAAACAPGADTENEDENGVENDGKSLEKMRDESLANLDQTACDAAGGEARQEGMLGLWRCVMPYADAGETCSDESDCEGRCLGADDITDYEAPAGEAQGHCEADDSPFGCYAEIRDGAVESMICVD